MMSVYTIDRKIEIDAAHRVMTHGSKCRGLHGHRYVIHAEAVAAELHKDHGVQHDMVLDFGFLKDEMMSLIHFYCDHGIIISVRDEEMLKLLLSEKDIASVEDHLDYCRKNPDTLPDFRYITNAQHPLQATKVCVIENVPTAEVLSEHWFKVLYPRIRHRSGHNATLKQVVVFETPNCSAKYLPSPAELDRLESMVSR